MKDRVVREVPPARRPATGSASTSTTRGATSRRVAGPEGPVRGEHVLRDEASARDGPHGGAGHLHPREERRRRPEVVEHRREDRGRHPRDGKRAGVPLVRASAGDRGRGEGDGSRHACPEVDNIPARAGARPRSPRRPRRPDRRGRGRRAPGVRRQGARGERARRRRAAHRAWTSRAAGSRGSRSWTTAPACRPRTRGSRSSGTRRRRSARSRTSTSHRRRWASAARRCPRSRPSRASSSRRRPTSPASGPRSSPSAARLRASRPARHPKGTRVVVEDLFGNVPARRKFLKSAEAELRAVVKAVTTLALSRPDVAFTLGAGAGSFSICRRRPGIASRFREVLGLAAPAPPRDVDVRVRRHDAHGRRDAAGHDVPVAHAPVVLRERPRHPGRDRGARRRARDARGAALGPPRGIRALSHLRPRSSAT